MHVSARGLAEIASHEAIVTSKYKDSVGVWTIGIGHTASAGHPDPKAVQGKLSLDDIMEIFASDINRFEDRARKAFTVALTQEEFDAAVSFDFNTGGIDRATWVKHINAGDRDAARQSFMNWRKPKEIIPRRQKECDLFFDHVYANDGFVNVYPATAVGKVQWSKVKRIKLPTHIVGADISKTDTSKTDTSNIDTDIIKTCVSGVNGVERMANSTVNRSHSIFSQILVYLRNFFANIKG